MYGQARFTEAELGTGFSCRCQVFGLFRVWSLMLRVQGTLAGVGQVWGKGSEIRVGAMRLLRCLSDETCSRKTEWVSECERERES